MNALAVKMLRAIKDDDFTADELRSAATDIAYRACDFCTADLIKMEKTIQKLVNREAERVDLRSRRTKRGDELYER